MSEYNNSHLTWNGELKVAPVTLVGYRQLCAGVGEQTMVSYHFVDKQHIELYTWLTPSRGGRGRMSGEAFERVLLCREERKVEVVRRLKSIAGHLKGVEKMVKEAMLTVLISSTKSKPFRLLAKVNMQILDDRLHGCLATAVRGDDADERAYAGEVATLFERSTKL